MISGVSAYAHQEWQVQLGQAGMHGQKQAEAAGRRSAVQGSLPGQGPDTLQISQEARDLLAAKMDEFDAETPHDLTREERDNIRQALAETDGVTDEDRAALAEAAQRERKGPPPGGGRPPKGGGPGGMGGPPPKKETTGAGSSDEVDDLKEEIEDLQAEIEALQAKASQDEEAAKELKAKRIELSTLEAELTLLQQQESASM